MRLLSEAKCNRKSHSESQLTIVRPNGYFTLLKTILLRFSLLVCYRGHAIWRRIVLRRRDGRLRERKREGAKRRQQEKKLTHRTHLGKARGGIVIVQTVEVIVRRRRVLRRVERRTTGGRTASVRGLASSLCLLLDLG